jgi:type IV secretory pathway TraG/TraD family ATPase VirD4
MGRLVSSYASDLKRLKGGRNDVVIAASLGLFFSALLTWTLIQWTFPTGFDGWLKLMGSHIYWIEFKRMTLEKAPELKITQRREFLNFLQYWETFSSLHALYKWSALGSFFAAAAGWTFIKARYLSKVQTAEKLRKGEQTLVTPKELQSFVKSAVKDKSRPHTYRESDVFFGKEEIRVCDETIGLHLGIGGASQTGKTNAINRLLHSRAEVGEKVLVVDPNGEFFARFGKPNDVVLSLHDRRASKWDFWSEGVSEEELAKALVEVRDGMDANTKFFQTTGRAVLTSFLRVAKKSPHRLRELWRLANLPAEELEQVLRSANEISHRYLGQGDSGQASGVIATSLMNLEFLKYLNHNATTREAQKGKGEESFSIRSWVLNERDSRWVFLVASDSHWEQTKALVRLWFDIASTAILERVCLEERLTPLWLVCDEISTVGLLPSLPKVLDRGYKYSGRLVLGFQSLSQIEQIYGREASSNIMQGLQNLLIFACNENKLAREFSERLGKVEVEEYESTVSPAEGKNPMRLSISSRQREKTSVTPDEIRGLPENVAYLKLARFPPAKIQFPYVRFADSLVRSKEMSEVPEFSWLDEKVIEAEREKSKKDFSSQSGVDESAAFKETNRVKPLSESMEGAKQKAEQKAQQPKPASPQKEETLWEENEKSFKPTQEEAKDPTLEKKPQTKSKGPSRNSSSRWMM